LVIKKQWTASCGGGEVMTLLGNYPHVLFTLATIVCPHPESAHELKMLSYITNELAYTARHIPAYPSEPDQFHLVAEKAGQDFLIKWKEMNSLNANLKTQTVFLDFHGRAIDHFGHFGTFDEIVHYGDINLKLNEKMKDETIEITYMVMDSAMQTTTEIKIKADIERK
jgi:hypothetical protein